MLGRFTTNTTDVRYRDVAEYIAMRALIETMPDLTRQGKKVTASMMQKFRDDWTRDGVPMDFTTMKMRGNDLEALIKSTGATSFGAIDADKSKSLTQNIVAFSTRVSREYDAEMQKGNYLHVVTDPEIREHVLAGIGNVNKAIFVHKGASLRTLNSGDKATLTHLTDPSFKLDVMIPNLEAALDAGFSAAPVAAPPVAAQAAVQAQAQQQEEEVSAETFIAEGESFLGWDGGRDAQGDTVRGLSHVLGAYVTKADAKEIAKNIDPNQEFPGEYVQNSLALLRHMRSKGYGFSVGKSNKRNAIDVKMESGENLSVRVLDLEKQGSFIGRVYDTYNEYWFNAKVDKSRIESVKFNEQDATAILDYVTGNRKGVVKKAVSRDTSMVSIEGVDNIKSLQIRPTKASRYDDLVFRDGEDARAYIDEAIETATATVTAALHAETIQAKIDEGYARLAEDPEFTLSSPSFQAEFESLYSSDAVIREAQQRAVAMMIPSTDGGREFLDSLTRDIVGTYDEGFDPSVVLQYMAKTDAGIERDALVSALKINGYDGNRLRGNDFAVNAIRERLIGFNPETAQTIDEVTDPRMKQALQVVQDTLVGGRFRGVEGTKPLVMVDDRGVVRWEALRETGAKASSPNKWQAISGEIGQIMLPDEDGIIKTDFEGDINYGLVPGYTGYFSFDGDYDNRMNRFRVKGFEQHLHEKLAQTVTHQMTRPLHAELGDIPTTLDASALNGLYHGDVYGKRLDADFMDANQLKPEVKAAIIQTLSNRVRFDNQFSDYATTSAETQAKRDKGRGDDAGAFSYWKAAGETNMRVLDADLENIADMTMTGTGKTQGLIWYLTDGATVNADGSVTPSKGWVDKDGKTVADRTALQKLDYFDNRAFSAWDRTQMSSNQLMTAVKVDEKVGTALMAFGGWTFDDSYAVSKEFAERNKVFGAVPNEESREVLNDVILLTSLHGDEVTPERVTEGTGMHWSEAVIEKGRALHRATDGTASTSAEWQAYRDFLDEHGRFRPLQRGDKLSDFGGNKGTIGIVIDRHMSPEEAKALQLEKEVAFMKANPKLDVVSAPYSMLSRHNAGVVKELMSGETSDLIDPETGETLKDAMGELNIIVTDMMVDEKTHAYTKEDILEGKGRKASGQLAWALQSKNAEGIMNEIYGHNDNAWATLREYMVATGLDMQPDGKIVKGYTPHAGEERHVFTYDEAVDGNAFLNQIQEQGGFLELPFPVEFANGTQTTSLPVLSASLRQNTELIDGTMRRNDFTNQYVQIYEQVGAYLATEDVKEREAIVQKAQADFDNIQSTIIDRQFNGGHNGKHSYIRDHIMGKRMENSATGVAIVDPRLDIGEMGMNQAMMDSLGAKEGDVIMGWRDPVWRDGAIRSFTVKHDETVHGVAINPIADKSHDMDFDGDTMGLIKLSSPEAQRELVEKFSHWANMIDHGSGKDELYFQSGMDLATATAKAEKLGDTSPKELLESIHERAKTSSDHRVLKKACKDLSTYSKKLFREYGFAGDYVSLTNDETVHQSFKQMVDHGAKGNDKKLQDYMEYHNGAKTAKDARDIQYATGVKSDDTGLAGAFSQKLVSVMRNQNIKAALEAMYPLTQGTLQIKHDAKHAVIVNELLTNDMNKTFRGKDVRDPKKGLTPKQFKTQLTDIMENKMKVDVNEQFIDELTDVLTVNGKIVPLKEAMELKGSPMDRVAYGGGYEELCNLAENGESLLTGEQNKLFAPFSMRNANEETKIAKRDTQRQVTAQAEAELEKQKAKAEVAEIAAAAEDDGIEP